MHKLVIFVLAMGLMAPALILQPAMAVGETSFDQIANTTLNNLTYENQTANIVFPDNGTTIYRLEYSPPVVQAVVLGNDLQVQMMIVQTFFIVVIGLIAVVRATYDLMCWIHSKRGV